jgi:hypothetical protein
MFVVLSDAKAVGDQPIYKEVPVYMQNIESGDVINLVDRGFGYGYSTVDKISSGTLINYGAPQTVKEITNSGTNVLFKGAVAVPDSYDGTVVDSGGKQYFFGGTKLEKITVRNIGLLFVGGIDYLAVINKFKEYLNSRRKFDSEAEKKLIIDYIKDSKKLNGAKSLDTTRFETIINNYIGKIYKHGMLSELFDEGVSDINVMLKKHLEEIIIEADGGENVPDKNRKVISDLIDLYLILRYNIDFLNFFIGGYFSRIENSLMLMITNEDIKNIV